MTRRKESIYYTFIFWTVIILHFINNYFWLKQSNNMFGIDVTNHLLFQLRFEHMLHTIIVHPHSSIFTKVKEFIHLMNTPMASPSCIYWPNFVYLTSTIFSLALGNSLCIVKLTMFMYFLLLLISIYGIAKTIWDKQTGLMAMFLVSMYPLVFESSRQYGLDLPLTALVTLSVWLLLKTDYFANSYYSLMLGISSGIAMLIKGQFILFFIWPLLFIFKNTNKKYFLNICIFILAWIIIALIWWVNKIHIAFLAFIEHITSAQKFLETTTVKEMYSLDFYFYHFKVLFFNCIGAVLSCAFLLSVFYFIKTKARYRGLLLSWVFTPFLLFSLLFVIKQDRFLMPALPAIAIVTAQGIRSIVAEKFKKIIIFLLILFGLLQYLIFSYFSDWYNYQFKLKKVLPFFGTSSFGTVASYDSEKCRIARETVEAISKTCPQGGNVVAGIVAISGHLSPLEILYWLYYWNPDLCVFDWLENYDSFFRELPNLSYLVFISYRQDGFSWPKGKECLERGVKYNFINLQLCETFSDWGTNFNKLSALESQFYLLRTIDFANGLRWHIYKRKTINN